MNMYNVYIHLQLHKHLHFFTVTLVTANKYWVDEMKDNANLWQLVT